MANRVTVIGAGTWGTGLSKLLAENGHHVVLHCYPAEIAAGINTNRRNPLYFPSIELPDNITATADISEALRDCSVAYLVVPTRYLRKFILAEQATWLKWAGTNPVLCNCTKGLLVDPTERTDVWLAQSLLGIELCHLAGPNFAIELVKGLPGAAVAAGPVHAAEMVQRQLMSDHFRIYTGDDLTGIEVAGFYKNIIAIAAGAANGLELGNNARATLVTRALAEMGRLVEYFGGQKQTLMGLAGIGDLMLTCSSELSRNFQVGIRRAHGQALNDIIDDMDQVAEGIQACKALHLWPAEHGLSDWPDLPIADEVYDILYGDTEPHTGLQRLMRRPPKAE